MDNIDIMLGFFGLGVFSRIELLLLSCLRAVRLLSKWFLEFCGSVQETKVFINPEWLETVTQKEAVVESTSRANDPLARS